ncbi:FtsX-like permease family protein [Amycolatopsis thermophila]|uniref:ABC3 transporter permease C-terminal domain-containing protein n=1 Tax=Amycolatopsis thermophila TaxID=206084 RepID=A0ABU0F4X8_9PSEU|nr:FtsX-like permease family protein [Amycolatopsis thermophila]MDQ0382102.1 hypothetical protein [Amycolatopsis thermophila]
MLRLSWHTFTDRWQLFLGAILTVCLGVALVQSSLLILVSAATAGGEAVEAITLLGLTPAVSAFLAVFIVSSTFAFTVAQRRRDLALLRLVGGARGQVRRLLLSEALLLGVIGTGAGVPLGLLAMRAQTWLLHDLGFVPATFTARRQDWILGVSPGVGLGVAVVGVLAASRRAAKVRPMEALRETRRPPRRPGGHHDRTVGSGRWWGGVPAEPGTGLGHHPHRGPRPRLRRRHRDRAGGRHCRRPGRLHRHPHPRPRERIAGRPDRRQHRGRRRFPAGRQLRDRADR